MKPTLYLLAVERFNSLIIPIRYWPPLMVYLAAGIQGLTGIVGTFFIKSHLNLSAEFLAALAFWVGIPWAFKIPIGHLIDLLWRFKSWFVVLGAALITLHLFIMLRLIAEPQAMAAILPINTWFVLAALLSPIGYVLQDAVADALTTEAVLPESDSRTAAQVKAEHVRLQTLGRMAIIGGTVLVALLNVWVFRDVGESDSAQKIEQYLTVYRAAFAIPLISVLGVALALILQRQDARAQPVSIDTVAVQYPLLLGSLIFICFTLGMGLLSWSWSQEAVFLGSLVIVLGLIRHLVRELPASSRNTLLGTMWVIFMFRATPNTGAGVTWWMIDELKFDENFFSTLSLISSTLTLAGLFWFQGFIARRSIYQIIVWLSIVGALLSLPILALSLGWHEITARWSGGLIDARFIMMVDTALESPLGQVAMVPMLAWIAQSAPRHLKATYFAVMASFTNLALSASQLLTKYLNQIFVLSREVPASDTQLAIHANYNDLTPLLISVILIGLSMPIFAVLLARIIGWRSHA